MSANCFNFWGPSPLGYISQMKIAGVAIDWHDAVLSSTSSRSSHVTEKNNLIWNADNGVFGVKGILRWPLAS